MRVPRSLSLTSGGSSAGCSRANCSIPTPYRAYRIVRDAAPPTKENLWVEHEFTAGWIALRFLKDPPPATDHRRWRPRWPLPRLFPVEEAHCGRALRHLGRRRRTGLAIRRGHFPRLPWEANAWKTLMTAWRSSWATSQTTMTRSNRNRTDHREGAGRCNRPFSWKSSSHRLIRRWGWNS
jgi:hypothetical protein